MQQVATNGSAGGINVPDRTVEHEPSPHVVRIDSGAEMFGKDDTWHGNTAISPPRRRRQAGQPAEDPRKLCSPLIENESQANPEFEGIVGDSPLMAEMLSRIRRIAPHYRAVLITGETGTGKDLAARALHRLSPAASNRYVVLNCPALVETLFESEIFGHVKGSFTGASYDKPGLFEHADGGTLFLDEIGDMPLATQAKLLRVLQNQEVQRVGSLTTRHVNVRVVAATNHDLRALIAQKCFREDLFYRLSMVEIHVPSLAQRKEDLPLLQRHFLARFAGEYGKAIDGLTPAAEIRLSQHSWPGNVRELENVIGHAAIMTTGNMIDVPDLPLYLLADSGHGANLMQRPAALPRTLEDEERQVLVTALAVSGGNRSKAARSLRIGRDALRYKLRKYNLDTREPLAAEGLLPETLGNTANSRNTDTRLRKGAQPEANGSGCNSGTRRRNTA